ncbi:MAG TPA: von Willebrand factor type A domain-containing protein [Cyclobacteriaceae bacterium]
MKKIAIVLSLFFIAFEIPQKPWAVKGKVTDEKNLPLEGVRIVLKNSKTSTKTDSLGNFILEIPAEPTILTFSLAGYENREMMVKKPTNMEVSLKKSEMVIPDKAEYEVVDEVFSTRLETLGDAQRAAKFSVDFSSSSWGIVAEGSPQFNTEEYAAINENIFHDPTKIPLSTFSIDVDAASYSNMRRFIKLGQKPPKDAVRIEEMVNYFEYDYPQPKGKAPFSITTALSTAPWNDQHQLVHIGLQGKKIPTGNLPPSNLVFLIDVSGSMRSPSKLPLLKSAFKLLTEELRPQDKISLVVYAGAAGVVLPSTQGDEKAKIINALDGLQSGGSTAGGEGIRLAYKIALDSFVEGGNNRVILATDGDFNIGASSNAEMQRLIEEKRKDGVFLTVLGFGMGNYKDSKMEVLADKGNGNYAYIDNILEARKVLVNEFGGTLFTIAKDVKIQVEFNPAHVQAYRLIGYENRKLNAEDFNDDKKDAGELGSGHTVTALYEVIPVGVESEFVGNIDGLKYQKQKEVINNEKVSDELLTVKFRYKEPDGEKSKLITEVLANKASQLGNTPDNFRWSAAVAAFGMMLRDSEFKGKTDQQLILDLANGSIGEDENGYRLEFINLVKSSSFLAKR